MVKFLLGSLIMAYIKCQTCSEGQILCNGTCYTGTTCPETSVYYTPQYQANTQYVANPNTYGAGAYANGYANYETNGSYQDNGYIPTTGAAYGKRAYRAISNIPEYQKEFYDSYSAEINIDAEFLLKLVCRKQQCCSGCKTKPIFKIVETEVPIMVSVQSLPTIPLVDSMQLIYNINGLISSYSGSSSAYQQTPIGIPQQMQTAQIVNQYGSNVQQAPYQTPVSMYA